MHLEAVIARTDPSAVNTYSGYSTVVEVIRIFPILDTTQIYDRFFVHIVIKITKKIDLGAEIAR